MTQASATRAAAVAGQFYPTSPLQLRHQVEHLLHQAATDELTPSRLIIAPHAGLMYSGIVAARAYVQLEHSASASPRVVIIGPAHRVYLQGLAVSSARRWQTPLGAIEIDRQLTAVCLQQTDICILDEAHRQEHCVEVQLPFLQLLFEQFTLLPLVAGDVGAESISQLLERLWQEPNTLFVISSDLSHFHDHETATALDGNTIATITSLNCSDLQPEQACGCRPLNGLLMFARRHGHSLRLLDRRTSGDSAGSRDRVVGYAAFVMQ